MLLPNGARHCDEQCDRSYGGCWERRLNCVCIVLLVFVRRGLWWLWRWSNPLTSRWRSVELLIVIAAGKSKATNILNSRTQVNLISRERGIHEWIKFLQLIHLGDGISVGDVGWTVIVWFGTRAVVDVVGETTSTGQDVLARLKLSVLFFLRFLLFLLASCITGSGLLAQAASCSLKR